MRSLRITRLLLGVPLVHLAKVSGVSTREIERLERGDAIPRRDTWARIDAAIVGIVRDRALEGAAHA